MKTVLRWLIPIGISGLALWLVLRQIEFSEFIDHLSQIGYVPFLLATFAYFLSFLFRALCWFILLKRKVSYKDAFFTMGAGYLLNHIFPFRLGEVGRAVLLDNLEGITFFEVLSSVLVERIFDVFLAALFVLLMLPRILGEGYDPTWTVIALSLALVGLVILLLAAKNRVRIISWLEQWGHRAEFIKTWVIPKATQVLEGLSVLNEPRSFLFAISALAISWFIAFGMNYVIFQNLYPNPPFWWMIFVLSAGAFGAALPSAPAAIGVFEGVMVAAFALLSVDSGIAFTHAIVVHMLTFVYGNIIGLIGLKMRGEALTSFYRRVVQRSPKPQTIE